MQRGGWWNLQPITHQLEAEVTTWTRDWHQGWGQVCRTEPLTWGICCYHSVDSVKTQWNRRTDHWYSRMAWWCGKNPHPGIGSRTILSFPEVWAKSQIWKVQSSDIRRRPQSSSLGEEWFPPPHPLLALVFDTLVYLEVEKGYFKLALKMGQTSHS